MKMAMTANRRYRGVLRPVSALLTGLFLLMMLAGAALPAAAIEVNDAFSPAGAQWGQESINGWTHMSQSKGSGAYSPLPYHANVDETPAMLKNRYGLPDAGVYLFAEEGGYFHTDASYNYVAAFTAPIGGRVEVSVVLRRGGAPGEADNFIYFSALKNSEQVYPAGSGGEAILQNDGANYTRTFEVDVKKGTVLYLKAECAASKDGILFPTVTYLSFNDQVEETPVEDPYVGKTFSPDMAKWGTQNNNGWSYMYQKNGSSLYENLTWRAAADTAIDWQKNNFASDPDDLGEMLFISPSSFFVGEKGTRPVYAYKAPIGGKVELIVTTHGTTDMRMHFYKNSDSLKVNGQECISFNTDGNTTYKITVDVKKDTMLYMEGSTVGGAREGWLIDYGVKYLSTNSSYEGDDKEKPGEDPYAGKVYAPDMNKWGTQGNNGWYYMYKERLGNNYRELSWYDGTSAIEWQQNRFAFDPELMAEMLFINKESFFVGENGSKPTYAFKAPVGGRVELSVITHGTTDMRMQIFQNNELVKVKGQEFITFNTDGNTEYIVTLDLKKDTMVYLVGSSVGEAREGWVFGTTVKYLSSNDEVETPSASLAGKSFTIDISAGAWGQKNNNNWEFMFWDTVDKTYKSMAFVRSENMFKGPSDAGYEYLMIKTQEMHPSIQGYPAKVFVAPADGRVEIAAAGILHSADASETGTGIRFMKGTKTIYPTNAAYVKMDSKETVVKTVVDVKKGDRIAVLLDPINGNIISDATNVFVCATYLSGEGELPGGTSPVTGSDLPFLPLALAATCGAAGLIISRRRRLGTI